VGRSRRDGGRQRHDDRTHVSVRVQNDRCHAIASAHSRCASKPSVLAHRHLLVLRRFAGPDHWRSALVAELVARSQSGTARPARQPCCGHVIATDIALCPLKLRQSGDRVVRIHAATIPLASRASLTSISCHRWSADVRHIARRSAPTGSHTLHTRQPPSPSRRDSQWRHFWFPRTD
jgi:hypothetical protein